MLDSPIFQVIIGLTFIFSIFSVMVTQVNTSVAYLFQLRARSLKDGIWGLLTDSETRAKFMAHPLIRMIPSLVQPDAKISAQDANQIAEEKPTGVSWVEPELFSQTLIDILAAYANDRLFRSLYEATGKVLEGAEKTQIIEMIRRFQNGGIGVTELQNAINSLTDPEDRGVLLIQFEQVNEMRRQLQANNEESKLIPLLAGVQEVADPGMRKALETLLASAKTVDEAQMKLETWFNARMSLVTEFYKRNMTRISYIVGIVLVVTLNIDTLQISRTLWNDPIVRETVAAAAQIALNDGSLEQQLARSQAELQAALDRLNESGIPPAEVTAEAQALPEVQTIEILPETEIAASTSSVPRDVFTDLLSLRLPIGWEHQPVEGGCPQSEIIPDPCSNGRNTWLLMPGNNPSWFGFILAKLAGWALTVLAIAQGAPFWFDLLNRIARPRSES